MRQNYLRVRTATFLSLPRGNLPLSVLSKLKILPLSSFLLSIYFFLYLNSNHVQKSKLKTRRIFLFFRRRLGRRTFFQPRFTSFCSDFLGFDKFLLRTVFRVVNRRIFTTKCSYSEVQKLSAHKLSEFRKNFPNLAKTFPFFWKSVFGLWSKTFPIF